MRHLFILLVLALTLPSPSFAAPLKPVSEWTLERVDDVPCVMMRRYEENTTFLLADKKLLFIRKSWPGLTAPQTTKVHRGFTDALGEAEAEVVDAGGGFTGISIEDDDPLENWPHETIYRVQYADQAVELDLGSDSFFWNERIECVRKADGR